MTEGLDRREPTISLSMPRNYRPPSLKFGHLPLKGDHQSLAGFWSAVQKGAQGSMTCLW